MRAFLLVFLCVALNVSAQLLLKKGAAEKGQTLLDDGLSPAAWLTVVTHLGGDPETLDSSSPPTARASRCFAILIGCFLTFT